MREILRINITLSLLMVPTKKQQWIKCATTIFSTTIHSNLFYKCHWCYSILFPLGHLIRSLNKHMFSLVEYNHTKRMRIIIISTHHLKTRTLTLWGALHRRAFYANQTKTCNRRVSQNHAANFTTPHNRRWARAPPAYTKRVRFINRDRDYTKSRRAKTLCGKARSQPSYRRR